MAWHKCTCVHQNEASKNQHCVNRETVWKGSQTFFCIKFVTADAEKACGCCLERKVIEAAPNPVEVESQSSQWLRQFQFLHGQFQYLQSLTHSWIGDLVSCQVVPIFLVPIS